MTCERSDTKCKGQDSSYIHLDKITSLGVVVGEASSKDCGVRRDTVWIKELNIEIQSLYRSGLSCDSYIKELIIIKDKEGKTVKKYRYLLINYGIDDWYAEASWNKKNLNQEELRKLINKHLETAKRVEG